ncbi:hypothetical protein BJ322DRAFT_1094977 [Thelephora terrestris]|uniref:Uncharacterized protein n=1 Tax=Thelephora terrestris TaxID=56493 RepID=A0A9P6L1D3_9AGAM|nr:hypothetical protein BJ322DRAFT_1094977 [Thelephora terrestris]
MTNHRTTLLKFFIALLLATATSALPANNGLLQNTGVQLGCTEGCNHYADVMETTHDDGSGYGSNAGSALSVTTGFGFMAMFLWTLLGLL